MRRSRKTCTCKDRLHLNEEGYKLWNADFGPALREEWAKVKGN